MPEESTFFELLSSMLVMLTAILFLSQSFSSYIIKPLTYDGTLVRSGRYSFMFPAWDTIEEQDGKAVVAIGSSLTQYAINGSCISAQTQPEDVAAYNLGVPGSYPYLDMIQTNRAINSDPELVMIEVNPISLSPVSGIPNQNVILRLTLASLHLKHSDYGEWHEILRKEDKQYIDEILQNRFNSESIYFDDSLEELFNRYNERNGEGEWWQINRHWYLSTPDPSSQEWENYLSEPTWLTKYLSKLSPEELDKYENVTIPNLMKRDRYNPVLDSNLNYESLDYMVSSFSNHGIPVMLISYPLHPVAMKALAPNQFDTHNSSIETLLEYNDVTSLNLIWEGNWTKNDFYDYEHLDDLGRKKVCSVISNQLNNTEWD